MRQRSICVKVAVGFVLPALLATGAQAGKFKVIHYFAAGSGDGGPFSYEMR